MNVKPYDLRRRLYIIMRGEEGLDYGGIARWEKTSVCVIPELMLCSSWAARLSFTATRLILTYAFNVGNCGVATPFWNFASPFFLSRNVSKL